MNKKRPKTHQTSQHANRVSEHPLISEYVESPDKEEELEKSIAHLKNKLHEKPDDPFIHHELNMAYLSRELHGEALDYGLKALRLAEMQQNRDKVFLRTHYNVSLSYYRLGNLKAAEETALNALKISADHMDSHFIMTIICFDLKRWKDVVHHADQYFRLLATGKKDAAAYGTLLRCSANDKWNVHLLLGIARYESGDAHFDQSLKAGLKAAPDPFLVARAAGIYFSNSGNSDIAKPYLKVAHKIHPEDEAVAAQLNALTKPKTTISCVLIVKNEEVFLDKCLSSVKDWVDEIIVVDTGSDDDTVGIAKRFTDKIYYHPWEGSFSKARNQAMQYASGDWIFQIDGDEEMIEGSGKLLREAVESAGRSDAYLVTLISPYANGTKTARHNFERLFRNNGVIHYESIVHNLVVGQTFTKPSKIEIMHYGYNVDEKKANEKFIRTTDLLKKQIAENPANPLPHHYLGTSYLSHGYCKECIAEAEKAIELAEGINSDHTIYLWSHHNAAMSYFYLGDMKNARQHALRALEKFAGHLDSFHVLTLVAMEAEEWENVVQYGDKYLERLDFYKMHSDEAGVIMNATMQEGASACLLIGHACYRIGDLKRMQGYYSRAEGMVDDPWQPWLDAAAYHMDKTQDYTEALALAGEALRLAPQEQRVWYAMARLGSLMNNLDHEYYWLTRLQQSGDKDEAILNRLAVLMLERGETKNAADILEMVLSDRSGNLQALLNIGIAYKRLQNYEKAVQNFMQLLEITPEDPKPWFHLSEISKVLGRAEEAEIFWTRAQALQG